jgi:hypothetical protein
MFHDYYSVERFMREHHRELIAAACRARQAEAAGRRAREAAHRARAARTAERRGIRRPTVLVLVLAAAGRLLVTMGRSMETRAAAAARSQAAKFCDEQPTAAGC